MPLFHRTLEQSPYILALARLHKDSQGSIEPGDRCEHDGCTRRDLLLDTYKCSRDGIGSMDGNSVAHSTCSYVLIWRKQFDTDDDGAHPEEPQWIDNGPVGVGTNP